MPAAIAPLWAGWRLGLGNPPGPLQPSSAGGTPPDPAEIPVTWLSEPLKLRLERPYTHAEVTQFDGPTARSDSTTLSTYSVFPFSATLYTPVDADTANLAHFTVTYNADPRMRSPYLSINLLYRSDDEKAYLLGIGRNRRIRITGLPDEWPAGADTLVIRGIQHSATTLGRQLIWITGPVIGTTPGVAGPWFRTGTSSLGGSDIRPF